MEFIKNRPLSEITTMRLGGLAKYSCVIKTKEDILQAVQFAKDKRLKIITLGGGSNTIFTDNGFSGLVIINNLLGISLKGNVIEAASGENWDDVVKYAVDNNFAGIESLSLIPGTVGGGPVNNIGAYGQEIKDTLFSVETYDTVSEKFVTISNEKCGFSYRDSIFKSTEHGRYIINKVTLKLKKFDSDYKLPEYKALKDELGEIENYNLSNIRQAVIKIRQAKLPDPKLIANTGSFFKNPFVSIDKFYDLSKIYPDMPSYPAENRVKIPAGWLIDQAGLKGYGNFGIRVYEKQALVLVNESATTYGQLERMINYVRQKVLDKFGISLDIEPEIIK